jgi:kynurenine formamidase
MLRSLLFTLLLTIASTGFADDSWYPSKYGAQDTLGALNLLKPAHALAAARLVRTGKSYALGVETGADTPAFGTRSFQMVTVQGGDSTGGSLGSNKTTFHDDLLTTWLGIGTQIDGLAHLGINHRYYNGVHGSELLRANGVSKYGIHLLPPFVTRGVMLDIAALSGLEMLVGGTAINTVEIEAAMKRQGVMIGEGDVVIFNTGWQALADSDPIRFMASSPGLGMAGAKYLAAKGVVAIGADNWGLEAVPAEDETQAFPVHQELLAKQGIYILENIRTDQLAADKAYEFMFVLGQPRFVGAVQVVINPVAIR